MTDEPTKTVTRREVLIDADLDDASYTYEPSSIDLQDGQTLTEWVQVQREDGQTVAEVARDLDLLSEVRLYLQLVEHYDDGTSKCVERVNWTEA